MCVALFCVGIETIGLTTEKEAYGLSRFINPIVIKYYKLRILRLSPYSQLTLIRQTTLIICNDITNSECFSDGYSEDLDNNEDIRPILKKNIFTYQ